MVFVVRFQGLGDHLEVEFSFHSVKKMFKSAVLDGHCYMLCIFCLISDAANFEVIVLILTTQRNRKCSWHARMAELLRRPVTHMPAL